MRVTIKTLQGENFPVDVDPSQKISEVKRVISSAKADFEVEKQTLIFSGKVLKDDSTIMELNLTDKDFLVCMLAKKKPAAIVQPITNTPTVTTPARTEQPPPQQQQQQHRSPTLTPSVPTRPANQQPVRQPTVVAENPASIASIVEMGFLESEAKSALRAARGNVDLAIEYLMTGIPDNAQIQEEPQRTTTTTTTTSVPTPQGLEALRNHPQFNSLRRLIQSNPSSLQAVLQQIGQQQPELLASIHANQEAFLQMMNEPIVENEPAPTQGGMGGGLGGITPAQMAQLISSMPEQQRNQLAASMGIPPQQLNQISQMIASLPPEQFEQLMGGLGGGGGGGRRPTEIRLTQEEMDAVNRLTELGFDKNEALQAYLACEKNEALAANLLMDELASGAMDYFPNQGGDGGNHEDDDDHGADDMYS